MELNPVVIISAFLKSYIIKKLRKLNLVVSVYAFGKSMLEYTRCTLQSLSHASNMRGETHVYHIEVERKQQKNTPAIYRHWKSQGKQQEYESASVSRAQAKSVSLARPSKLGQRFEGCGKRLWDPIWP